MLGLRPAIVGTSLGRWTFGDDGCEEIRRFSSLANPAPLREIEDIGLLLLQLKLQGGGTGFSSTASCSYSQVFLGSY